MTDHTGLHYTLFVSRLYSYYAIQEEAKPACVCPNKRGGDEYMQNTPNSGTYTKSKTKMYSTSDNTKERRYDETSNLFETEKEDSRTSSNDSTGFCAFTKKRRPPKFLPESNGEKNIKLKAVESDKLSYPLTLRRKFNSLLNL